MPKIYRIVLFSLVALSLKISAQTDTINKLDAKGKKTGYWKVFLDERVMPIDSANSYLYGYEFFESGKSVYPVFITEKNLTRYKITYEGKLPEKGNPMAINGTLKWFDTKYGSDELILLDEFEGGYPKVFKEYCLSGSAVFQMLDFTKKYNNEVGTFYRESYYGFIIAKSKEKLTKYWFRKEKNKWKDCEIK
ncbi:MAG: hypothetical protein V4677_10820 [Bacteroidota bacterium]